MSDSSVVGSLPVEKRGRGRPKTQISRRIEGELGSLGSSRAYFGDDFGGVSEQLARVRLHNAAKRMGVRVSTTKVRGEDGALYVLGVVLPDPVATEAVGATQTSNVDALASARSDVGSVLAEEETTPTV